MDLAWERQSDSISSVDPIGEYQVVRLRNGAMAVYSTVYGEKMHPGLGPQAEAEALYVEQLNLRERSAASPGEFVVWDIGLGAAANALAALRATRDCPAPLRLVSFDNTTSPLTFALENASALGYLQDYQRQVRALLEQGEIAFADGEHAVTWRMQIGDFPEWLARRSPAGIKLAPPPDAILFDAYSPARNPAMWTLPLFTNLFHSLAPDRACALTTYSRSTMLRVTLLLAGFFVGRGRPTGMKEETTVAANCRELIAAPLDGTWLERAKRSGSAEPMRTAVYRQSPLASDTTRQLVAHPQFN